jgi:hypothetical protein
MSGAPVGGMIVDVLDGAGNVLAEATSAADGTYAVGGLPTGAFHMRFTGPAPDGYADQFFNGKATLAASDLVSVTGGLPKAGDAPPTTVVHAPRREVGAEAPWLPTAYPARTACGRRAPPCRIAVAHVTAFTARVKKGVLSVSLKTPVAVAKVTISSPALSVTRALVRSPKALTATVTVTDA